VPPSRCPHLYTIGGRCRIATAQNQNRPCTPSTKKRTAGLRLVGRSCKENRQPRTASAATIAIIISLGMAWRVYPGLRLSSVMVFAGTLISILAACWIVSLLLRVKFATGLPGYPWDKTLHLTPIKMTFFDRSLNENARDARFQAVRRNTETPLR